MEIIGIGHDIIEIERIKKLFFHNDKFLKRVFTRSEISYCCKKTNSDESFASRFAAKEAFSKAVGTGIGRKISWTDIEIMNSESGEPTIIRSEKLATLFPKIKCYHLTLSHSRNMASAFVILEG